MDEPLPSLSLDSAAKHLDFPRRHWVWGEPARGNHAEKIINKEGIQDNEIAHNSNGLHEFVPR